MNHRNQDQLTQAKPAQATSKAGPLKAELLKAGRMLFVPEIATDVAYLVCQDGKSAVVQYTAGGKPYAWGFAGASGKRAWAYYFANVERRADRVSTWMTAQDERHASKQAEKLARKNSPHSLVVGQILYASWGWEQTNVDFYEVIAVRGAAVDLRQVRKNMEYSDSMRGTCTAIAGSYCGEVIKGKRPDQHGNVKINRSAHAGPWDGRALGWTSYA